MAQLLVILAADAAREDLHARAVAMGGRVVQAYGPRVWIVDVPDGGADSGAGDGSDRGADSGAGDGGPIDGWPGVDAVFDGDVPPDVSVEDETGRLGIAAWNVRHSASFAATRANRVGEGRSWDDEGVEPEG